MPSISAKPPEHPIPVALIVFPGTKLLDMAGPMQVFSDAKCADGRRAYDVDLVSEFGGSIATDTICTVGTVSFEDVPDARWDTVLISGGNSALEAARSVRLLDFVDHTSRSCRRLGSICLGAFILAAGGHLTGLRATTHWDGSRKLTECYPEISVEDDAIFIEDHGIWTSAGVTAGIDMALAMVEQDLGPSEALRLAKSLVLHVRRGGGQRQFSSALATQHTGARTRFAGLISDMAANPRQDLTVSAMAARSGMSERNFARVFVSELGTSPARFVESLRVEHACDMLHFADAALAHVQDHAGFANAEQMRRAFQRCKGVSPTDYRAKFSLRDPVR
ncbi:MAG: helix-turn-helix domain-containing protein [Pseudomonadota bacterium]